MSCFDHNLLRRLQLTRIEVGSDFEIDIVGWLQSSVDTGRAEWFATGSKNSAVGTEMAVEALFLLAAEKGECLGGVCDWSGVPRARTNTTSRIRQSQVS